MFCIRLLIFTPGKYVMVSDITPCKMQELAEILFGLIVLLALIFQALTESITKSEHNPCFLLIKMQWFH